MRSNLLGLFASYAPRIPNFSFCVDRYTKDGWRFGFFMEHLLTSWAWKGQIPSPGMKVVKLSLFRRLPYDYSIGSVIKIDKIDEIDNSSSINKVRIFRATDNSLYHIKQSIPLAKEKK